MKKLIWIIIVIIILVFSMDLKSTDAQEIRELFNKVNPSVVIIRTLQIKPTLSTKEGYLSMEGQGSGVIISDDGLFVVVDYVNDQIDLRLKSQFVDGVPDAIVCEISRRIATLVDYNR